MNFLVGYDKSKETEQAIALSKKYAKAFGAKIHLLASTPYGPELEATAFEETTAALEKLKGSYMDDGVECVTHMVTRSLSPGEDLIDYSRQFSIDKIFIGAKRKSKIGILLMGSTAQYVVLEADCPVVVVK